MLNQSLLPTSVAALSATVQAMSAPLSINISHVSTEKYRNRVPSNANK
jgi:hypothetical protein